MTGKEQQTEREQPTQQAQGAPEQAYIVDEATDEVLRLELDKFEGPFEVLLYLIKSQEIDIFDIPVVKITEQYLRFLELFEDDNLEVAGDFLVMAATLIQIKSKMLLPVDLDEEDEELLDEEDPRMELVEKLIEYRKFRDVRERLELLEHQRQTWYTRKSKPKFDASDDEDEYLEVTLYDLMEAFRGVLRFISDDLFHQVDAETFSVDEKISQIDDMLTQNTSVAWTDIFKKCTSKMELICCFLAILELCRMGRVRAEQHRALDEIRLFPIEQPAVT